MFSVFCVVKVLPFWLLDTVLDAIAPAGVVDHYQLVAAAGQRQEGLVAWRHGSDQLAVEVPVEGAHLGSGVGDERHLLVRGRRVGTQPVGRAAIGRGDLWWVAAGDATTAVGQMGSALDRLALCPPPATSSGG